MVLVKFGTLSVFLEDFAPPIRPFPAQLSPAVGGNDGNDTTASGGSDDEEAGMDMVEVGNAASAKFIAFKELEERIKQDDRRSAFQIAPGQF